MIWENRFPDSGDGSVPDIELDKLEDRVEVLESLIGDGSGDLDLSSLATKKEVTDGFTEVDSRLTILEDIEIPDIGNLVTNEFLLEKLETKADVSIVTSISERVTILENIPEIDTSVFVTNEELLVQLGTKADVSDIHLLDTRVASLEAKEVPFATIFNTGGFMYSIQDDTFFIKLTK